MSTDYIDSISDLISSCKESHKGILGKLTKAGFSITEKVGTSNEYDIRGLIAGLDAQLIDLTLLCKKNNILSKTTPVERSILLESLTSISETLSQSVNILNNFQLNSYTLKKDGILTCLDVNSNPIQLPLVDIHLQTDKIKPILRSLNIRTDAKRLEYVEKDLEKLQINVTYSESIFEEIKGVKEKSDEEYKKIHDLIAVLDEKYLAYTDSIEALDKKIKVQIQSQSEIDSLQKDSLATHEIINKTANLVNDIKTKIMSNEAIVNNFVEKLIDNEKQLEQQKQESKAFAERLVEIESNNISLLEKARKLLSDAHESLNLAGTIALGSHFEKQHNESKEHVRWWLLGASIFLMVALSIGIWVLSDSNVKEVTVVIARISLMPLAIAGSWFCASQYVKQRKIIEDYAYKKVLAHSIISFKEELQSSEVDDHVKDYLNKVLSEIHRYPLELDKATDHDKRDENVINCIKNSLPDIIKTALKTGSS